LSFLHVDYLKRQLLVLWQVRVSPCLSTLVVILHLFADIQRICHIEVDLLACVVIYFLLLKEISQFLTVITLCIQIEAHVVDGGLSRPS
jgi:hypothetical protein